MLALVLAGGLIFVLQETSGRRGEGPATLLPSGDPRGALPARGVSPNGISGPRPRAPAGADREAQPAPGPLAAVESDLSGAVDVLVLDRSGGALLGAAGSLPALERRWVRPVLGRGRAPAYREELPRQGLEELAPRPQRVSQRTGWFHSFERPPGEAFVALAFGDHVLVAQPIDPTSREVVLVSDLADIEGMSARLEGRLPGMIEASTLVRVRPEAHAGLWPGRFPETFAVEGEGNRFVATALPPGRMTVLVRGEATAIQPALFAARKARGLSAISLGATVPSVEQWNLRLGVLRQLQLPIADIEITLAPGESRDLGVLSAPQAGAAILELRDDAGRPVDATSVDVMILGAPGKAPGPFMTWTFESSACLYPLHPRPAELMVVQGGLGALVKILPASLGVSAEPTATAVRLRPLGVVLLPVPGAGEPEPELWTAERNRVQNDPRWVGSTYLDHGIGGRTLAVPPGSYLAQTGSTASPAVVNVRPGEVVEIQGKNP